ncbi:acetate--CoA ligase family protein [Candidatus Dojkabacteria bacterium]|nr:acetate--CoA ligase family protein [Candidatus Dojkabacteria bacterium]
MLSSLLKPKSVAIIGASRNPSKIGSRVLKNIISGGFEGDVYPVNPEAETIQGITAFASVSDIPTIPDIAVIVIPAEYVPTAVEECVKKQVPNIIVITAGFSETGKHGAFLEEQVKERLKDSNTRLLGVNCLGLITQRSKLNASFASFMPNDGNVAFLSQSGAFGTSILDWTATFNVGVKYFISLGNKTDLTETDFLENFRDEEAIKCIALYLEDIEDGRRFASLVRSISPYKPIILLKPGKSKESKSAISSHTGSMVGDIEIAKQAAKQNGIIEVSTMRELFNMARFVSWNEITETQRVAIVTNAGGPAAHTTDVLVEASLTLAKLSEETKKNLKKILPTAASVKNPVDLLGDAPAKRYEDALNLVFKDPNVDSIIVVLTPQAMTQIPETANAISKIIEQTTKPILTSFIGGAQVIKGLNVLEKRNIPCFEFPEDAVSVLTHINNYQIQKNKILASNYPSDKKENQEKYLKIRAILQKVAVVSHVVPVTISNEIFKTLGIKIPDYITVNSSEEAISFGSTHKSIVLKLDSPQIVHKTEFSAVKIGLDTPEKIATAFSELTNTANSEMISNHTIMAQKQILNGLETILGVKIDTNFGPTIMFGSGGVTTELFHDISQSVAPVSNKDILDMVTSPKVYKLIKGFRGKPGYDIKELLKTIIILNNLVLNVPEIKEIEINPMILTRESGYAVDIRCIV